GVGEDDRIVVLESSRTHLFGKHLLDSRIDFRLVWLAVGSFELRIVRLHSGILDGESSALLAQFGYHLFSRWDGAVTKAHCGSDDQHLLRRCLGARRHGEGKGAHAKGSG